MWIARTLSLPPGGRGTAEAVKGERATSFYHELHQGWCVFCQYKILNESSPLSFIRKILQLAAVDVICVGEGEKMYRLDDIGELARLADAAADEHFLDEFGAIIGICLLITYLRAGKEEAEIVIMVSLFVFCHSLKSLLEVRILPLGNRDRKHLDLRARKALEGAVMRRLDDESAVEGVVGVGPAEGVHR